MPISLALLLVREEPSVEAIRRSSAQAVGIDRRGFFKLDTGSGSTVDFCSPAVARYGLLRDRSLGTAKTGGVGGDAESRTGTIAFFELAGRRFERVSVGFQITKKGAFASPFFDGNVGVGLLGASRLVLDYRRSRLACAKP